LYLCVRVQDFAKMRKNKINKKGIICQNIPICVLKNRHTYTHCFY
jgi:hypothetical protein